MGVYSLWERGAGIGMCFCLCQVLGAKEGEWMVVVL